MWSANVTSSSLVPASAWSASGYCIKAPHFKAARGMKNDTGSRSGVVLGIRPVLLESRFNKLGKWEDQEEGTSKSI
jgi:hypothetical protein